LFFYPLILPKGSQNDRVVCYVLSFNRRSAFIWVPTMHILSSCTFIHTRKASYRASEEKQKARTNRSIPLSAIKMMSFH